ncbi:deoxyribodipyrimidine photo-lyase [Shewanella sp. AS1]|uniref:deoxyribodipyrimidine photo-lyase n=1 Tax=Shewanella sp. AS1 TaxID=2907626 RepID=UPI001F473F7C|nr:deoxyribodipyrimidine photo-lyase [Shewanella sp. AS1]MCE9679480.1 deoxyribodipyrimidine photo-lyase [Shewanella sp. AS1]
MSVIYWSRRDCRLHDNPALTEALTQGATQALFISTPTQWQQQHLAPIKADFIERHLKQFATELAGVGLELIHLQARDFNEQQTLLKAFCQSHQIKTVLANSEPELDEINRDMQLIESGLDLKLYQCDTILQPGSVLNQQGQMFKVFTPFKQAWLKSVRGQGIDCVASPKRAASPVQVEPDSLQLDFPKTDSSAWPLSEQVMTHVLPQFWQNKLLDYKNKRDFPGIKGTSGLSPYLAIGAISPRWLALQLIQRHPEVIEDTEHKAFAWLNELIWRDFYRHLLFHYPDLIKGDSFQAKYQSMQWLGSDEDFSAWCEGRTGYPIVDAAMKQLLRTGWMHNRLRMIVASFLTKHLLVDWHKGERFFMGQLIDGDFSANNGGWQWAASTGCDAQPYFRIFNPITQSQKFDPSGDFIRKYLPELAAVPDKEIHFPHAYLEKNGLTHLYCPPIVDHKRARLRALDWYKAY